MTRTKTAAARVRAAQWPGREEKPADAARVVAGLPQISVARPRTPAQLTGDRAERAAAQSLESAGWAIVGRNVRAGRGELDILAIDPGPPRQLVAVEVRWRARRDFGLPEETVDFRKRGRLRTAVGWLLDRGCLPDGRWLPRLPLRIDLIVVEPPEVPRGKPRLRHYRHLG